MVHDNEIEVLDPMSKSICFSCKKETPLASPSYGCKTPYCICPTITLCKGCTKNYNNLRSILKEKYGLVYGCIWCCDSCSGNAIDGCDHHNSSYSVSFTTSVTTKKYFF